MRAIRCGYALNAIISGSSPAQQEWGDSIKSEQTLGVIWVVMAEVKRCQACYWRVVAGVLTDLVCCSAVRYGSPHPNPPRWGRELWVQDSFRCRKLIWGCDTPSGTGRTCK